MTSTPIPAGVLTDLCQALSDMHDEWLREASALPRIPDFPGYHVTFTDGYVQAARDVTVHRAKQLDELRARLLASQRPPGVPDDAVPVTVWISPEDKDGDCVVYGPSGRAWSQELAEGLRLAGVPVPPYQPTPPEPEPADPQAYTEAEYASWNNELPVSEARTGPLGLSEDDTRAVFDGGGMGAVGPHSRAYNALWRECGEFVARWDAEDAAPEPDPITVERDDLAAVMGDIDEWMHLVAPDAEMKDSVRRLRATAGLSVPSEGGRRDIKNDRSYGTRISDITGGER